MSKMICEICGEEIEDEVDTNGNEIGLIVLQGDGSARAWHYACGANKRLWNRVKSLEERVKELRGNAKLGTVEIRESAGHPEGLEDQR